MQLYPGKLQTWILVRAVERDTPNDSEIRDMAAATMWKWFGSPVTNAPLDLKLGGTRLGDADLVDIGKPSSAAPELPNMVQSWAMLPGPLPLLKPGKVVYVPVQFAWRSNSITSKPWPTRRVSWGFGGACPVDADWMLYQVGDVREAPEELGPLETIDEAIGNAVRSAVPGWLPWAVGAVAAAYVWNAIKPRS